MEGAISYLKPEEAAELEEFRVLIYGEEWRDYERKYIQESFSDSLHKRCYLLKRHNGRIIASVAFSEEIFTINLWGITAVAVHPDFRNQGIGGEMVKAALDAIAGRVNETVAAVLATYPDKTKLYERLGFEGNTKDYEGGLIMTRIVQPKSVSAK